MQRALSPYAAAGVALATAGAIAISPIAPPPAPIQLQTRTVELTATVDPLTQWAGIITRAVTEASQLGQIIAANPAPILQQIAQNQLANAQAISNTLQAVANGAGAMLNPSHPGGTAYLLIEAVRHLQEGDPVAASQAVWNGILGFFYQALLPLNNLTSIPANMATNFGKAVTAMTMVPYSIGFVAIGIAHAPFQAFEETSAAVAQALENQDPAAAATALLSFPGRVVDFAVNGYGTGNVRLGGLLGTGGLVYTLNSARTSIATAIAPPAPEEPFIERTTTAIGALPNPRAMLTAIGTALSDSGTDTAPAKNEGAQVPPTALDTRIEPTEESTAAEAVVPEPASEAAAPLARASLIATPNKAGTLGATGKPTARVPSDVRDGISATAKKIGEGVKKAFAKPEKATASGSTGAGKHRAGSGNSGDSK